MDSLTQIILGAAVAEASLGKKIGNRAMVWGAIAGTIPDLDVIANGFMTPIDALAFHRGITHSFLTEIILAIIIGWSVYHMYRWRHHKYIGIILWGAMIGLIGYGIMALTDYSVGGVSSGLLCLSGLGYLLYRQYTRPSYDSPVASIFDWQKMFFWSLFTHPILDCFTTYGTQFLLPFSSQRISWDNIAVADPLYTVPFMLCLIIAAFYRKENPTRTKWNNAGLIISSLYMIFTLFNKQYINGVFEESLAKQHIDASRFMTSPTILNNILWSGVAETDSAYYYGTYSLMDAEKKFVLKRKDKTSLALLDKYKETETLKTLRWFSKDYYYMAQDRPDTLAYYDLRFGTFKINAKAPDEFVFKFDITNKGSDFTMLPQDERGPRGMSMSEAFTSLWRRMMGEL
jgi:inner membrane protein